MENLKLGRIGHILETEQKINNSDLQFTKCLVLSGFQTQTTSLSVSSMP